MNLDAMIKWPAIGDNIIKVSKKKTTVKTKDAATAWI